jgi:hypothetical protein
MVDAKRRISQKPFNGETIQFQAMLLDFSANGLNVFMKQDDSDGSIRLPLKMFNRNSLYDLRRADLGEVLTLRMGSKVFKKIGLLELRSNTETATKEVTMENLDTTNQEDEGFAIDLPEPKEVDTTKLLPYQVFAKMRELGTLYDELKGEYVIFSMKGPRLHMRPRGNAEASEYK